MFFFNWWTVPRVKIIFPINTPDFCIIGRIKDLNSLFAISIGSFGSMNFFHIAASALLAFSLSNSTPLWKLQDADIVIPKYVYWVTMSYFIRVTRVWNTLLEEMRQRHISLSQFKNMLLKYYDSALRNNYCVDDPRTWKSICPKCNITRNLSGSLTCCAWAVARAKC